ncbi:alpha/beta hydrolase [Glaciibacter psychrotolerans]|uniref:Alpha-beta hydrolase superfamily lysophospholipase n=1 Tax=Glaciibacter psychrotolerans TaxID=670054 RepID=A0A7Z0EFH0_9MICO|nr:alpha/beta hydrolase [Leifsonia psychrotolerans]NYJ20712.1 alpha-beta hydrolase superfamily lysophospholipase [Leifsonia psychrotolerans]
MRIPENGWQPDILGAGFEALTLSLKPDAEGPVVATLVRAVGRFRLELVRPIAAGVDVLYLHGWSDYFFQTELADFWQDAGAHFHALDLRKYGRSLREGQTPGYITDLAAYDEDIEAALSAMGHGEGSRSKRQLLLLGHSTGGLILSLWANRHRGRASALVLNSPWLEFQASGVGRAAIQPIIDLQARVDPRAPLPRVDLGFYTRSVSADYEGSWTYKKEWRPERGFMAHPAWLRAILAGHARVASGLAIDAPVLSMISARSMLVPKWEPAMMTSDVVLRVDDIAVRSTRLGALVTILRLDGALHDVFLSAEPVRRQAYRELTRWLRSYLQPENERMS